MSDIFHKFVELPTEVRLMIWEATVSRDQPGVQILKICNRGLDLLNGDLIRLHVDDTYGIQLAPPRVEDKENDIGTPRSRWWRKGNPSTCLADHGLWIACKESRRVVWLLNQHEQTTIFTDSVKVVAMRPNKDLFLIQNDGFLTVEWEDLRRQQYSIQTHPSLRPRRVAFEFDLYWIVAFERKHGRKQLMVSIKNTSIDLAIQVETFGYLWIVDYSLVRRIFADACGPDGCAHGLDGCVQENLASFYAGGYKLVQVKMRYNNDRGEPVGWKCIERKDGEPHLFTSINLFNDVYRTLISRGPLAINGYCQQLFERIKLMALEES